MQRKWKKLLSLLLCFAMVAGLLPVSALAAEETTAVFPHQYPAENGETALKLSHPQVAPNTGYGIDRTNDGVVDYIGDGKLTDTIGSENTSGARGESYSWSALGYGDWIYTGLLYNAMGSTIDQMKGSLGYQFDRETMNAILNTLYNGDFFLGEEDNGNPGGALVKINAKTGEVQILMSISTGKYPGKSVFFRNAVEYKDKFYFCGSVNGAPQIWQVDPKTDECKMVYGMSVTDFYAGYQQGISSGIRGLCVYGDELIISCVMKNKKTGSIEPQICSTTDPEQGFTVIATQSDLFDYPAYHFTDSIYGGSIWEIVEFNNKLYVSICTGTPDNMPDAYTMQSFAIVCGEKQADGGWSWRPVIGDKNDDAAYTFGIDPERTCSGAGVLTVYGDHLYIGEYNDEEIALIEVIFNLDSAFMNKNLAQSVNLYRMDKEENIELIVGDKTKMFPAGGLSGIGSGFGHNENQYIWRMAVYNDKLYCGTFDTSSLLEPIGQFSNGDLAKWTPEQWHKLFGYIRELLKLTMDKNGPEWMDAETAQTREEIRSLFELFDATAAYAIDGAYDGADAEIDAEGDMLAQIFSALPDACFTAGDTAATRTISSALANTFEGAATMSLTDADEADSALEGWQEIARSMQKLIHITKNVVKTAQYMSDAQRGFDLYVSEDGVSFDTITTNGFGDPFNHGLRVFAETDRGLGIGTANPFYGTQWWLLPGEKKQNLHTVTVEGSYASTTGAGKYKCNDTVSISAGSRSGYAFDGWTTQDGVSLVDASAADTSFTMPDCDVSVTATWRQTGGNGSSESSSGGSSSSGFSGKYNYPVVIEPFDHGSAKADKNYAVAGEKVTITITPEAGYDLEDIAVTDQNGKVIAVTKTGNNTYTFTMPEGKATVSVSTEKASYSLKMVLQIGNKNIVVNGKPFTYDTAPIIDANNRTLVPIRIITEQLGGNVVWNEALQTVTLRMHSNVYAMTIGQIIPGFDTAAIIDENSRTLVPVRYVAEKLGARVDWIAETQQIVITK